MPSKPPSPCLHPGCRLLVLAGAYCDLHRSARRLQQSRTYSATRSEKQQSNSELATAQTVRNSARWQTVRDVIRAKHPVCCDPFNRHSNESPQLTTQIHHIEPIGKRPELAFEDSNLAPLCDSCHASSEALERRGKRTRAWFDKFLEGCGFVKNLSLPYPAAFGVA